MENLLSVRDLKTHFRTAGGVVKAVDGISYDLGQGEALAIVGESGSGKSVSVKSLTHLIRPPGKVVGGEAFFGGRDLLKMAPGDIRKIRGREIGMVFQDPMSTLNPTITVGRQIMEPLLWHGLANRKEAAERAQELLALVGIPAPKQRLNEYPFQFSGGMRQRVMIAMAIACQPKLLIADEPTTALDVTVQAQILDLLADMRERLGMSIVLITHDFGVAARFCDRVIVMYAGRVAEEASIDTFLNRPSHPYSRGLLNSTLEVGRERTALEPIPGSPPNMVRPPSGCPFHPRCASASARCVTDVPVLSDVGTAHRVACWHPQEEVTPVGSSRA